MTFEILFLLFLCGNTALFFYFYVRQVRSVRLHRDVIPHVFTGSVTLKEHQKASDLSLLQAKFREVHRITNLGVILVLTYGGLLGWYFSAINSEFGTGLTSQYLVVFGVMAAFLIVDLIFYALAKNESYPVSVLPGGTQSFFRRITFLILTALVVLPIWNSGISYWWVWAGLATFALSSLTHLGFSLTVSCQPMPDGELKSRLEGFLKRIKFNSAELYLAKDDSWNYDDNVRVLGIGSKKKVVLSTFILNKLTPLEIEALIANKVCQNKLDNKFTSWMTGLVCSILFFLILETVSTKLWFYSGLGVETFELPSHGLALTLFVIAAYVFIYPLIPFRNTLSWMKDERAERSSVRLVDWNALISALVKETAHHAGSLVPDSWYYKLVSRTPDVMYRIRLIQHLAPRHTRQRDSWLPNA